MPANGFRFTEGDMPERFMMASRGYVGRIAYFAQEAATMAVSLDKPLHIDYLAEAYRRPYSVSPRQNPFLIANIRDYCPPKSNKELEADERTYLKGTKKADKYQDDDSGDALYD
jgi:hypothetical protein